jgi:RNA polymerase sigma factor FliA
MTARIAKRDELIASGMQTLRWEARRFIDHVPSTTDLGDLVGAGALGLIDAAERFNPTLGATFTTFAHWRIRGAIVDSLRADAPLTRSVCRDVEAFEDAWSELAQDLDREPTRAEVMAYLDVAPRARQRLDAAAQRVAICSLNVPIVETGDELGDLLRWTDPGADQLELRDVLRAAIAALPERLAYVIHARFFEDLTHADVGRELGVTDARACQMQTEALKLLRAALAGTAADPAMATA